MVQKKKYALIIFFVLVTLGSISSLYIPKSFAEQEDVIVIPSEAIRLRILANSNSAEDQKIKRIVRDRVNEQITEWVSGLTSIEEARTSIVNNLDELEMIAQNVLAENNIKQPVKVEFGKVDFPTKLYGNFLYPAGSYEAVLITIGKGAGANWWCVLFPPLCFLDFSSGSAVSDGLEDEGQKEGKDGTNDDGQELFIAEEEEEVEVKFFLLEFFKRLFS